MNEDNGMKTNYNDSRDNHESESRYSHTSYMPNQSNYTERGYTDSFYDEYEDSGVGSFLLGAIVGGVIGAAAALFLAPKTGKEMRDDFSTQASHLKDKGIEISTVAKDKTVEFTSVAKDKASEYASVAKDKAAEYTAVAKDKAAEYTAVAKDKASEYTSVAKDKANEFTTVAKEKTDEVSKTLQEQSGQFVNKVKSMTSKSSVPMDDGTVSSEGEEAVKFVEKAKVQKSEVKEDVEDLTATAQAIKDAVTNSDSN